MPGKEVAKEVISMEFGVVLGFDDRRIDVLKWTSIETAEYQVKL